MSNHYSDMPVSSFLEKNNYVINECSVSENKISYTVSHPRMSPMLCASCNGGLRKWGDKCLTLLDIPINNLPVEITIAVKRFRCKSCGQSYLQDLPGIAQGRRMSDDLVRWIGLMVREKTFVSIAESIGVVEGTVRNAFSDYIKLMNKYLRVEGASTVYFVQTKAVNHERLAVVSSDNQILDLVPNFDKGMVTHYLERVANPDDVKFVLVPLNNVAIESAQAAFTKAKVVIASEEILALINAGMARTWRAYSREISADKKKLAAPNGLSWSSVPTGEELRMQREFFFALGGQLCAAYTFWSECHRIYSDHTNVTDLLALEKFFNAVNAIKSKPHQPAFTEFISAFEKYKTEILNYFKMDVKHRSQSLYELGAIVEEFLEEFGRGYSFESLRAKILYPIDVPTDPFITKGPPLAGWRSV